MSVSPAGDTIAWLGRSSGDHIAGEYVILGGQFKGQGGNWQVSQMSALAVPQGLPLDAGLMDVIIAGAAPFKIGGSTPVRAAASPPATPADDGSGFLVAIVLLAATVFVASWAMRGWLRKRWADRVVAAGPGDPYAVLCPICDKRPIVEVRRYWFMHGLILMARYGSRAVIGCHHCVRDEGLRQLGLNSVTGWWSIPWGLGTPFVVLQNLIALVRPAVPGDLEAALTRAGIDPADVRLDAEGFTREQRRLIESACFVLATAIWTDRRDTAIERARAVAILVQFAGGRLSPSAAEEMLARGRQFTGPLVDLPFDLRQTLLAMALDIALADGSLALPEIAMLHAVADSLGFGRRAVDDLLADAMGRPRDPAASGAEDEGARRPRNRAPGADDIRRACVVLDVAAGASLYDVKQAWRRAMLKHHPDRAGRDKAKQAAFHTRAQEINWAYQLLQQQRGGGSNQAR